MDNGVVLHNCKVGGNFRMLIDVSLGYINHLENQVITIFYEQRVGENRIIISNDLIIKYFCTDIC